jgi:hypothetical protein
VPDFFSAKYDYWYTPEGAVELSQLIDEFCEESDEYPLES